MGDGCIVRNRAINFGHLLENCSIDGFSHVLWLCDWVRIPSGAHTGD